MKPTSIQRYILQGRTAEPIATTATAAAASQAYYAMVLSAWDRANLTPNMPTHNWAQSGFQRSYDAAKYCGDYANGRQHAYATAACYTLSLPADALVGDTCHIVSLAVRIYGDRWLADGAILTAVFSASAEPPAWADVLANGTHSEPLMMVTPNNTGADSAMAAVIEWDAAAAPAYIHLVLRLADYTTARGAWIEGSALLDQASLSLTFDREVDPDPGSADVDPADAIGNLVVPLRVYDAVSSNRTRVYFDGKGVNLESIHLRRNWAADMLRGGNGAADATDNVMALTPFITELGTTMQSRGYICKCWCPISAVAGSTAWFRAVGYALPHVSSLRVSLFAAAESPDPADPQTWSGSGNTCIGTASFTGMEAGDMLGVPLTKIATSPLWIVASIEAVARGEVAFGDPASGVSLIDAHIAALPVTTDATPHFVAVGAPPAVPIALMRDVEGASMLPVQYAFHAADYVAGLDSSFTWLSPGDVEPLFYHAAAVTGAINYAFAVVIDGNQALRIATNGTLPGAVTSLEGSLDYDDVAVMFGQTVALLSTAGAVAAVGGALGAALVAAINGAAISGASALCGRGQCLLVRSGSTATAVGVGLDGAFVSAVGALTGLGSGYGKIALGTQWAAFVRADGTAAALRLSDGSTSAAVVGWTGVQSIATDLDAVVGVDSLGNLLVAGGEGYAGLGADDITALNARYKFTGVISGTDGTAPRFFVGVEASR